MAAIFSRPQCVKNGDARDVIIQFKSVVTLNVINDPDYMSIPRYQGVWQVLLFIAH